MFLTTNLVGLSLGRLFLLNLYASFELLFVIIFIDKILIYSRGELDHASHLRIFLQTFRVKMIYVKFSKCEFWRMSVAFLGYIVSGEGITVDTQKFVRFRVDLDQYFKQI